jgi:hypothetical protein
MGKSGVAAARHGAFAMESCRTLPLCRPNIGMVSLLACCDLLVALGASAGRRRRVIGDVVIVHASLPVPCQSAAVQSRLPCPRLERPHLQRSWRNWPPEKCDLRQWWIVPLTSCGHQVEARSRRLAGVLALARHTPVPRLRTPGWFRHGYGEILDVDHATGFLIAEAPRKARFFF